MVYRRRYGSRSRRFRRRPRSLRRRRVRFSSRVARKKNRRIAPMLRYGPRRSVPRVVKVVYDYTERSLSLGALSGATLSSPTGHTMRCSVPTDPNVTHTTAGSVYDITAHGMPYWAAKYKYWQCLGSRASVKIQEQYSADPSTLALGENLVFQLVLNASSLGTAGTYSNDWELNQARSWVDTKRLGLYDGCKLKRTSLSMPYDYKSLHGPYEEPEKRAFDSGPNLGDQDYYVLLVGNESKNANPSGKTSVLFNVHWRIVYTIQVSEPITDESATYAALANAPDEFEPEGATMESMAPTNEANVDRPKHDE